MSIGASLFDLVHLLFHRCWFSVSDSLLRYHIFGFDGFI